MTNQTTVQPNAPMNDREFAVWEHGRIQGHVEAKREIERLRASVEAYSAVPFRCDNCGRKLTAQELGTDAR